MLNLKNHPEILEEIFKRSQEGIIVTDEKVKMIACNDAFCRITGYSRSELLGNNPSMLSSGKHDTDFYGRMWQTIREQGWWQGEVWNRNKHGEFYAELLTVNRLKLSDDQPPIYIGMMSDITKMKEHHATLEKLAHYDSLTKLPNRNLLEDRFDRAVAKSDRMQEMLAVCFLDLDDFKPVNDTYGHYVGDLLLIELTHRIEKTIREQDTASRYGGDEFVLLLGELHNRQDCENLLHKILNVLSQPYEIEGNIINIGVSIGYTLYPFDRGSLESLIDHADQTLYRVKNSGKNSISMYGDANLVNQNSRHSFNQPEVLTAIHEGQLRLHFQPKLNIANGELIGFEALVRWQHPEKGLLMPLEFLPSINESEVEISLGLWVIHEALTELQRWHEHGMKVTVSVNLSAYQLARGNFVEALRKICYDFPELDLSYFQIEILESHALDELSTIKNVIHACKEQLNITTALDDFGTGYSSLSHIRTLPISSVKIDQSFVRNMLNDPNDFKIVESVISLATSFDIDVIAEGVESLKHGQILLCMGCKMVQGYAISRPISAEEVLTWSCDFVAPALLLEEYRSISCLRVSQLRLFAHFLDVELEHAKRRILPSDPLRRAVRPDTIFSENSHCRFWLKKAFHVHFIEHTFLHYLDQEYSRLSYLISNCLTLLKCGDEKDAADDFQIAETQYRKLLDVIAKKLERLNQDAAVNTVH
jgi:diguanylate cyclase (GGDEF)-like protein/PAS domain S-box-containing protein